MNNKNEIFLKLTSNVIIDFLKNYAKENQNILFNESECSSYKSIRFSTITLDNEFKPVNKNIGYFKNGHFAYFEIKPETECWCLYLNISKIDLPYDLYIKLTNIYHNMVRENENVVTLYEINIADINDSAHNIIKSLHSFLEAKLLQVETDAFREKITTLNEADNLEYYNEIDLYIEGVLEEVFNNKYERNQQARQKCIKHYGTKCKICGFDFAEVYGNQFEGKIHVHHRVPLHEIKKEYVVDPIKDLIPVCPNCHMILHSKENGTYTVEEVIEIIKNNKE